MRTLYRQKALASCLVVLAAIVCIWALSNCGEDLTSILGADTGSGGDKTPCKNNAQCKSGQICKDGFCSSTGGGDGGDLQPCSSTLECGDGEECRGGQCVPLEGEDAGGGGDDSGKDIGVPDSDAGGCTETEGCGTGYKCDTQTHTCKPVAAIRVEPSDLDFGAVPFGSEVALDLSITNTGLDNLKVLDISFEAGTNPDPQKPIFRMVPSANMPATLQPGGSMGVDVTCRQDDARPDQGALLISSDDLGKPLTRVPLKNGYKGVPDLTIVDRSKDPPELLYPKSGATGEYVVDFGNVALDTDAQKTVTILNATQGDAILSLDDLKINKKTANEFKVTFKSATDPATVLEPPVFLSKGDMADMVIDYHPTVKVVDEETDLELSTDDDDMNNDGATGDDVLFFKLLAKAGWQPPAISVSKTSIAFGEVQKNTTASDTVKICNTGGDTLSVADTSGLEFAGTDFSLNPVSLLKTLAPTECLEVAVTFAPLALGQAVNNLVIDSDADNTPQVTVPITGTGTDPTITVFPSGVDFGTVYIGNPVAPQVVTVKNTGNGRLTVTGIALTPGSSADYRVTNKPQLPAVLRDNQQDTLTFSVEFSPSAKGAVTGAVQIDNSDAKSPYVIVTLNGVADYAIGHPCLVPLDCPNGFCTDGYCCNEKCDGLCERCDVATKEGACTAVPQGNDPDNECDAEAATSCGKTGSCAGQRGKCELWTFGTVCKVQSCMSGYQINAKTCDGNGVCTLPDPAMQACAPYECDAVSQGCFTKCTTGSQCAAGNDCSAAGECKKARGTTCLSDGECASGFCTDGVCCDGRCGGTCERCNQTSRLGYCDPVALNTDPENECTEDPPNSCGKTGFCGGNRACGLASATTACSTGTCNGNTATLPDMCNGTGTCVDKGTQDCTPYKCDTVNGTCKAQCDADGDCTTGFKCKTSTHECLKDNGQACNAHAECMSGGCCNNVCKALNTLTDCGGCNVACNRANATATCSSGSCQIAACNSGYDNCDGNEANGCEVNHTAYGETCAAASNLGAACGEYNCDTALFCTSSGSWTFLTSASDKKSRWFKGTAQKCTGCDGVNVGHRTTLSVPSGIEYQLCYYYSCGGSPSCTTVTGTQTVTITKWDTSFDYWIEVRYSSGQSCSNWTLTVDWKDCGIL